MIKKHKVSQEDIENFYNSLTGTKRLITKKVRLSEKPTLQNTVRKTKERLGITLEETFDVDTVGPEGFITYKQPSISNKTLRKLRKGQYNVDAKLDLHGMTVEQARMAVSEFLMDCIDQSLRVVLIVHGKGARNNVAVLKNKLNDWLRKTNAVLAFCSAAQKHGSHGATYVLLKRGMEERL